MAKMLGNVMSWIDDTEKNPPKSVWVNINQRSVHAHYWSYSDCVTIVFIHGAIANNVWWQHIASKLHVGRVLSISLSGHGRSSHHPPYSLHQHACEVQELLEIYGQGPIILIGHSYGGAVAALVAANVEIQQVVMVDTPFDVALESKPPSSRLYQKPVYTTLKEALKHFKPLPHQPVKDAELLAWVGQQSVVKTDNGYTWQFDPLFHQREVLDNDIEQVKQVLPTAQYWYGELSPFASNAALGLAKTMGMSLLEIPKAYHAVTLDNPRFLLENIQRLLDDFK
ncbi:alpha/beta hydrolase [Candidatus Synchoanobacter obligatus]|uniref:Alpha/beta hydrolase n=1 Tax=Candidatus Synchoanobacter obligatus TaxID=2919597 RepID=A0ABT1L3D3_9GAMM|nr:alpha/beta hydrolase [Candidatus Synchoanobacter obligatus]MCP8351728.1 alpha/beta hydrolase [Candidatus Synchoanobacter obligatus]